MFTSSIKSKSFFNGEFKIDVEFTDGTQKWTEPLTIIGSDDLNFKVKARLQVLNGLEAFSTSLTIGAYTPTQDVSVPETQDDKDRKIWFRNFNKLDQLTRLNTLGGLRPALVADLDELKATVAADFKKAYIADM